MWQMALGAVLALAALGVIGVRRERASYLRSLSPDDRERLRGFCLTGHNWREFRRIEAAGR